jgi:hypothetical protein
VSTTGSGAELGLVEGVDEPVGVGVAVCVWSPFAVALGGGVGSGETAAQLVSVIVNPIASDAVAARAIVRPLFIDTLSNPMSRL